SPPHQCFVPNSRSTHNAPRTTPSAQRLALYCFLSLLDISSRILRSSPVRLSSPSAEILSSTRLTSSAFRSREAIFRLGVIAAGRFAAIALLFATISSTSSHGSRERG